MHHLLSVLCFRGMALAPEGSARGPWGLSDTGWDVGSPGCKWPRHFGTGVGEGGRLAWGAPCPSLLPDLGLTHL